MIANEIEVDSFAGGGGASLGMTWATGRSPFIAINHDELALEMHEANHPETLHVREDVWKAQLTKLIGKRKVGLLWLSPDCKHFSVAKGAKPVEKNIRSLAWIACKWAEQIKPRIIILENVREFAQWCPLVPVFECRDCEWRGTEGQATLIRTRRKCPRCDCRKLRQTVDMMPCPDRKGLTFRRFIGRLKNLGYKVEYRNLDAADYGARTHRKRLFLIARRDGKPIVWPEPTHAAPNKLDTTPLFDRLKPYGTAAECIDWNIPCPSIFTRKKPLADKTMRRIAMGIKRFVLDNSTPFIVPLTHTGERRCHPLDEPVPTITTAKRGEFALVTPTIVQTTHTGSTGRSSYTWPVDQPARTVTQSQEHAVVAPILSKYHGQKGDESRCSEMDDPFATLDTQPRYALVSPTLFEAAQGADGRWGDGTKDLQKPMGTIHAGGNNHALATAHLVRHHGGDGTVGRELDRPAPTAVGRETANQLCTAFLAKHFGGMVGVPLGTPLPTTTSKGCQNQLVTATLLQTGYGEREGQAPRALDPEKPLGTVVGTGKHAVAAANLIHMNHGEKQWSSVEEPLRTQTTSNHAALVYAFLTKYFGTAIGSNLLEPHPTNTTKERTGLVMVKVQGEPYVIVDIGMRMLTPRELARAQGFPDTYILTGTKTSQVARIGNSVCPHMAKALVEANYVKEPVCV